MDSGAERQYLMSPRSVDFIKVSELYPEDILRDAVCLAGGPGQQRYATADTVRGTGQEEPTLPVGI